MIDADGNLLGGTTDGLVGVRNGQRHRLDSSNGLPCDLVRSVIIDDDGNLWLAMSCGIVSIARDQIERWWRDPASPIESRLFDPSDGASNDSPNGNPRVAKTADGKLWFATGGLLSMVDPHRLPINHIAPPVSIESLMVDSVRHDPHEALRLPAQPGNLEIDYTALSFVNPQRVRFRYRLEGRDKAWQDAGTRRQAFYNDLAPGQYRFQVIAANASGIWNETGDAISFEIPPAWYQSVAFRAACAVLVLMLAWGLYRLRIRQVAAVFSARFEERLLERTRIARDLHDTLLQTVQGSKMVADNALADPTPERLHQTMGRLSEWLSEAIEEARSALQALRTTSDDSHDLVDRIREAIRQPVDDASLTTSLVIEGEARPLRPIARDQIYRIVQEALLNARRHAGATRLEVTLSYVEGLLLTIRDNGQGVSPDIIRDGRPGHFGLRGMHERAQRIGASLELESSPENGTTVRLVVPMKNNFSTEI
jgi:signal transduction histidine kinase